MLDGWNDEVQIAPPPKPPLGGSVLPPRTDNLNSNSRVRGSKSDVARGSKSSNVRRLDSLDSSGVDTRPQSGAAQPTAVPTTQSVAQWEGMDSEDGVEGDGDSVDHDLEDKLEASELEPTFSPPVQVLETLEAEGPPAEVMFPVGSREPSDTPTEAPRPPSAAAPAAEVLSHISKGNATHSPAAASSPPTTQHGRYFGYREEPVPMPTTPSDELIEPKPEAKPIPPEELARAAQQRVAEHRAAQDAAIKKKKADEDAFRKRRLQQRGHKGSTLSIDDGSGGKLALLHYLKNGEQGTKKCYYSVDDGQGGKKRKRLSNQKRKMLLSLLLLDTNIGAKDVSWKSNALVRALAYSAGVGVTMDAPKSMFSSQFGIISRREHAGASLVKRNEYTPTSTKIPRTLHAAHFSRTDDEDEAPLPMPTKGKVPFHYCYCPGHPHEHFAVSNELQISPKKKTALVAPPKDAPSTKSRSLAEVTHTAFPEISPRAVGDPSMVVPYRPAPPSSSSSRPRAPATAPKVVDGAQQRHVARLDKFERAAEEERKYWSAKYMFERQQRLAEKRVYLRELTAMWAERFDRSPYWATQVDVRVVEDRARLGRKGVDGADGTSTLPRHPLDEGTGRIAFESSGHLKRMKLVRRRVPSPADRRLSPGMRRRSHNFTEGEMIELLGADVAGDGDSVESLATQAVLQAVGEQSDPILRRRMLAKELRHRHPRFLKVRKQFPVVVVRENPSHESAEGGEIPANRELMIQTDEMRPGDSDWFFLYEGSSDDEAFSDGGEDGNAYPFILVELGADEPLEEGDEVVEFFNIRLGTPSRPSTREGALGAGGKKVSFGEGNEPSELDGPTPASSLVTLDVGQLSPTRSVNQDHVGGTKRRKKKRVPPPSPYKAKVHHKPDGSMVVKRDLYTPPVVAGASKTTPITKALEGYSSAARLLGSKVESAHRYREDIVIRYEPVGRGNGPNSPSSRLRFHSVPPSQEGVPPSAHDNNFLRTHYRKLHRLEDEVGLEMQKLTQQQQLSEQQQAGRQRNISGPPRAPKPPPRGPPRGSDPSQSPSASAASDPRPNSAPFSDYNYIQRPYRPSRSSPLSVEEELGLQVDPSRVTAGELARRLSSPLSRRSNSRGRSPEDVEQRRLQEEEYRLAQEAHAREMAEVEAEIAALERAGQMAGDSVDRASSSPSSPLYYDEEL